MMYKNFVYTYIVLFRDCLEIHSSTLQHLIVKPRAYEKHSKSRPNPCILDFVPNTLHSRFCSQSFGFDTQRWALGKKRG